MPKPEFNIVIVGSGNMAHALGKLLGKKHRIQQVISRNKTTGKKLAASLKAVYSTSLNDALTDADFYLLCVPDDSISTVSKALKKVNGILVHHSGSRPIEEINGKKRAVIYPFLSVNKTVDLNKKETALFYEVKHADDSFMIKQLLKGFKFKPESISGKKRATLHLAAVLVNNFTNHLYFKASGLVKKDKKSVELLAQLAQQSLTNLRTGKTKENQSGPARRKDINTVKNHLRLLKTDRKMHDIYVSITQSIFNTYLR